MIGRKKVTRENIRSIWKRNKKKIERKSEENENDKYPKKKNNIAIVN